MTPLSVLVTAACLATTPVGRPVHTYSIVARDSVTGDIGVAVQSHYFGVGAVVPWAEAGVGAVATQSIVEVAYGPQGLALMRAGLSAPAALDSLLRADSLANVRQVGMIDAQGRAQAHTGAQCIPDAGQVVGDGFACQANLMANGRVWNAMADAYRAANGDLADRLLAALDAAQAAGGDIRGQQSAALLVVRGRASGQPWADRIFDLRVEDDPQPLTELRRLVQLARAYNRCTDGDNLTAAGRLDDAARAYSDAMLLAPENNELIFWSAVSLYTSGKEEEAAPLFRRVFTRDKRWSQLVPRLVPAGLFPNDSTKVAAVLALAPKWTPRAATNVHRTPTTRKSTAHTPKKSPKKTSKKKRR